MNIIYSGRSRYIFRHWLYFGGDMLIIWRTHYRRHALLFLLDLY